VKEQLPGLAARDLQTSPEHGKTGSQAPQVNVNPSGGIINNLGGTGLVDRCQSCHLGTDPADRARDDDGDESRPRSGQEQACAYASHPDPDMMKYHS